MSEDSEYGLHDYCYSEADMDRLRDRIEELERVLSQLLLFADGYKVPGTKEARNVLEKKS